MSIPGNSGFQDPPKVSLSDVINFQLGTKILQTSFAKALQEADTESVVIVNIHQPIQSTQIEISHAKVRKNTKKKRASLNQQIRDMIQKSIRTSKYRKKSRTDKNIENKENSMFVIDHHRETVKQLKDREDKIREENHRKRRKFDENMQSASYKSSLDKNFERESTQNLQKSRSTIYNDLQLQKPFDVTKKEKRTKEEPIVAELLDHKQTEAEIEKELDNNEVISQSEVSTTIPETKAKPIANILPTPSPLTTVDSSSSISPHCIMSLPPDFFELFEKLVGVMMVQQNSSGITNVTVIMHRPGSPLDKSEVLLEFFDTNPRSCNVELRGSPEAVHYFQKYHGEFVANFRESKLSLQLNIRQPSLLPEKKVSRKRKRDE